MHVKTIRILGLTLAVLGILAIAYFLTRAGSDLATVLQDCPGTTMRTPACQASQVDVNEVRPIGIGGLVLLVTGLVFALAAPAIASPAEPNGSTIDAHGEPTADERRLTDDG